MTLGAKVAAALWMTAVAWDFVCPEDETVSHGFARGIANKWTRYPISIGILITVAHLFALARTEAARR